MNVELESGIYAGINMRIEAGGLVPFYEEHEARIIVGYSFEAWRALDRWERALEVAHFRVRRAVKNHQSEAESRHMENKARRAKK